MFDGDTGFFLLLPMTCSHVVSAGRNHLPDYNLTYARGLHSKMLIAVKILKVNYINEM
jgi:hypothetical protein